MCSMPRRPALLLVALVGCSAPGEGPRSTATTLAARPAAVPDAQSLAGQWMRADSQYMLSIDGVLADGKLLARYLNPRPINVSRAEWKADGARLDLLVELRDRLYPGSYYELTYDAGSDGLSGVYHHLGTNEDFDVAFYRVRKGGDAAPLPAPSAR
jgi:hypothetical protein